VGGRAAGREIHLSVDDADLLAMTYYLLLQDRITEADAAFGRINPAKIQTRMQYDYCAAYLEMFNDDPKKAPSIVAKYVNYPVDRWKNTFNTIMAQLDEIEGKGNKVVDPMDKGMQQDNLAATEPSFEFTLENKAIQLIWQNLETVRVNYYLMDVELLFSRNPFVQQGGNQFASIRPNATREVTLLKGQNKIGIPLPDDLAKRNVLVEVVGAGKTRSAAYYANEMDVKFTENYGQVRVIENAPGGKTLPKVYVKVYAKLADGSVKFHKDGYTDLRGRFDYASVNTPERQAIQRFSVSFS
jgi:acyl-CoA-binding protein